MKSRHLLPINLKKKKQSRKHFAQVITTFQTFSSPLLFLPQLIWCDVDVKIKKQEKLKKEKKCKKVFLFLTESSHVHNHILLK